MPLEANYKTADGRITFRVAGANVKDVFLAIADLQQIFEAETCCRICNTANPKFRVRPTDKGNYFELTCSNPECGARFDFGQLREGDGLFPKRKDADGNLLPDGGWYIYVHSAQPRQQQAPPPRTRQPSWPPSGPPPRNDGSGW